MAYKLKEGRIQHNEEPQVGDVVLVKDDLPHGNWKIGRICELRTSQDGQIRSGRVLLPNKKTLNRPLNLLYPIECSKEMRPKIERILMKIKVLEVSRRQVLEMSR